MGQVFLQVLQLSGKAGLVELGHVAIEGTTLQAEVERLLAQAAEPAEEGTGTRPEVRGASPAGAGSRTSPAGTEGATQERVEQSLGAKQDAASADAGHFSEGQLNDERIKDMELYVATGRQYDQPGAPAAVPPRAPPAESASVAENMKHKLKTETSRRAFLLRGVIREGPSRMEVDLRYS